MEQRAQGITVSKMQRTTDANDNQGASCGRLGKHAIS